MITLQQQPDDRIQHFLSYKKELISKIMDLVPEEDPQYHLLKEELDITNDQIYILLGIDDSNDDKGSLDSIPVFPDPENGAI